MCEPRSEHAARVLDGKLYVIGGHTRRPYRCRNEVDECYAEVLDQSSGGWHKIAFDPASTAPSWPPTGPIFEFRDAVYALFWLSEDDMYQIRQEVISRFGRTTSSRVIHRFDPQIGKWDRVENDQTIGSIRRLLELSPEDLDEDIARATIEHCGGLSTALKPLLELGLCNRLCNDYVTPKMEMHDMVLDRVELPTQLWLRGVRLCEANEE